MSKYIKVGGSIGSGGSSTFAGLSDKAGVDLPGINTPLANALSGKASTTDVANHTSNIANPHSVTKTQVGLSNVDNTSDASKPISTATQTALGTKEATSNKKTDVDANKTSDTFFPSVKAVFDWVSGLFVKGAASSTDNAIARFDGGTGKLVQDSSAIVGDDGILIVNGVTLPERGQRLKIASYGSISETVGGAAFISGNNIASSPTQANMLVKTTNPSDSCQYIGMRYDKGIYLCTGIGSGDAIGTEYNDNTGISERMRITLNGDVGINITTPTARLDVNGTFRSRGSATFNGQVVDNVGSSGVDGQVLKKVGGLVVWANP